MNLSSLVALWAEKYGVETAIECVVGDAPSACDALATRGVRVLLHREGERVPDSQVDLVVVHGSAPVPADWRDWVNDLAKRATKLVVVAAPDPEQVSGARLRRFAARVLGRSRREPGGSGRDGEWGATPILAPVLWAIGRVREHERVGAGAHAFVVDVTPRTPQARRKLRLASTTG